MECKFNKDNTNRMFPRYNLSYSDLWNLDRLLHEIVFFKLQENNNCIWVWRMKKALAEVEDIKIKERITNKVRFADDTAIIAKTQEELQDMVN